MLKSNSMSEYLMRIIIRILALISLAVMIFALLIMVLPPAKWNDQQAANTIRSALQGYVIQNVLAFDGTITIVTGRYTDTDALEMLRSIGQRWNRDAYKIEQITILRSQFDEIRVRPRDWYLWQDRKLSDTAFMGRWLGA